MPLSIHNSPSCFNPFKKKKKKPYEQHKSKVYNIAVAPLTLSDNLF